MLSFQSEEDIAAVWTLTEVPAGLALYNDGRLTLRNGVEGRRGGASGNSYVTAVVPHAYSSAYVLVIMESRSLRTASDSCVFQASGDDGATWATVLTLDKHSPDGVSSGTTITVVAGGVTLRLTNNADGKREKCFLLAASVSCSGLP